MIFRSPFPDVDIPNAPLPGFVLAEAEARGDRPALIDGPTGRTVTYAQLAREVRGVAAGLASRGLTPGETVAIFAPNLPEYAIAFHGAAAAGATVTTINSLFSQDTVRAQLADARARFLVTVEPFLDRALPAAADAGVEETFVFGEAERSAATPFAALLADPAAAPTMSFDPATHIVALPYSSGTTGFAKGVRLTHRNLVANVIQSQAAIQIRDDDTLIGVLPFFHIYGLTVILNLALWCGATVVTMPKFELDRFLELLAEHRVTIACIVPPIVLALAKHPNVARFDVSSLDYVLSGAAPLDGALASAAADRLGTMVAQGYGLTESSPVVSAPARDALLSRPASIGMILPGTEIRIVDVQTAESLPAGVDGEIQVRGPQVMAGYLNDPDATAATLEDGWLHTGDIGHADGEGYLYCVDRLKELIKYRGFQVPPAELEALLLKPPRRGRCGRDPVARQCRGRDPESVRRPRGRRGDHRRRADVVGIRAGAVVQEDPADRLHRRDPKVRLRQDPAPRAGGARARAGAGARTLGLVHAGKVTPIAGRQGTRGTSGRSRRPRPPAHCPRRCPPRSRGWCDLG
jgi:acyl-CoA synthetase (AMP-forming)/AMP-acid ligase II